MPRGLKGAYRHLFIRSLLPKGLLHAQTFLLLLGRPPHAVPAGTSVQTAFDLASGNNCREGPRSREEAEAPGSSAAVGAAWHPTPVVVATCFGGTM